MKKVLFIINPVSGKKQSQTCMFEILEAFAAHDLVPTVYMTKYRGHASELAGEAAKSGAYDAVFCCGGDGTLNEVITGMLSAGKVLPIGYIPAGSTNDFATGLEIPLEPGEAAEAAARALVENDGFPIDVGCFGGTRYFSYIASFGAFSSSSYTAPQELKNALGHLAYVLEGLKDLFAIKPIHASCSDASGVVHEDDYVFCGVTNTYSVGGIVKLSERVVNMNDGQFEVMLVRMPRTPAELNTIIRAIMFSEYDCEMIDFFRTKSIVFNVPEGTQWSLDGEQADGGLCVVIDNITRAVNLLR